MCLQDVWTGEAAGLQQCSADPLPIHSRPLQCRLTQRFGIMRRVRAARRPTAHLWLATTVSGDPTVWCCAARASNVAEQQDVTATVALKTSLATPRQ
jgi:hypothetical protein